MVKLKHNKVSYRIYVDLEEFIRSHRCPFDFSGGKKLYNSDTSKRCYSTGFTALDDKVIRIYIDKYLCQFEDLLETVSHELGHLIEGGFERNPEDIEANFATHEAKAEHYQNFAVNAYNATVKIFHKL